MEREEGSAILAGILVIIVLIMIIGVIATIVPLYLRNVSIEAEYALALHTAESGLYHALTWLNQYPKDHMTYFESEFPYKKSEESYCIIEEDSSFSIDLTNDGVLTSYGTYQGRQRTISVKLAFESMFPADSLFAYCINYFQGTQTADENFKMPPVDPPIAPTFPTRPDLSDFEPWNGEFTIANPDPSPDAPPIKVLINKDLTIGDSLQIEGNVELLVTGSLALKNGAEIRTNGNVNITTGGDFIAKSSSLVSLGGEETTISAGGIIDINNDSQVSSDGNLTMFAGNNLRLHGGGNLIVQGDITVVANNNIDLNNKAVLYSDGGSRLFAAGDLTFHSEAFFTSREPVLLVVEGDLNVKSQVKVFIDNDQWNEVFVSGDVHLESASIVGNESLPNVVLFVLEPNRQITMTNKAKFYGGIFAPFTELKMHSGASIEGALICKHFINKGQFDMNDALLTYRPGGFGEDLGMFIATHWKLVK